MNLDRFGLAAITLAGTLEQKLAAIHAGGFRQVMLSARDVEEYNLERKPYVFNVFGWLAEATRG